MENYLWRIIYGELFMELFMFVIQTFGFLSVITLST